jgi:hypothetical protein
MAHPPFVSSASAAAILSAATALRRTATGAHRLEHGAPVGVGKAVVAQHGVGRGDAQLRQAAVGIRGVGHLVPQVFQQHAQERLRRRAVLND